MEQVYQLRLVFPHSEEPVRGTTWSTNIGFDMEQVSDLKVSSAEDWWVRAFVYLGGLWRKYDAMSLATPEAFYDNPSRCWVGIFRLSWCPAFMNADTLDIHFIS